MNDGRQWFVVFSLWCILLILINSSFVVLICGAVLATIVAVCILRVQKKIISSGHRYKRQVEIIDIAFSRCKTLESFAEMAVIRFLQPAFFAAVFIVLVREMLR